MKTYVLFPMVEEGQEVRAEFESSPEAITLIKVGLRATVIVGAGGLMLCYQNPKAQMVFTDWLDQMGIEYNLVDECEGRRTIDIDACEEVGIQ